MSPSTQPKMTTLKITLKVIHKKIGNIHNLSEPFAVHRIQQRKWVDKEDKAAKQAVDMTGPD